MNRKGHIEVICGCMFSGKSEELIRRIKRLVIGKKKVQLFKHALDNRYSATNVVSHDGAALLSIPVMKSEDIIVNICEDTEIVGIDEAQFFESDIIEDCLILINLGIDVIIAGLDMDFRGLPFGPMPNLMAIADKVDKLCAVCNVCGKEAIMSQRLINGKPADSTDLTVCIGEKDSYEARCRICHEVPGTAN